MVNDDIYISLVVKFFYPSSIEDKKQNCKKKTKLNNTEKQQFNMHMSGKY